MSIKQGIIDDLNILLQYKKQKGANSFSIQTVKSAINGLEKLPGEIHTIEDIDVLIGNYIAKNKKIYGYIKEFIETGSIIDIESIKKDITVISDSRKLSQTQRIIEEFAKIWGISTDFAQQLVSKHKIENIQQLRDNQYLLTHAQKIGLKYHEDLQKRIPRDYITTVGLMIQYVLEQKFGSNSFKMQLAGSYRRKQPTSGDIDILFTSKTINLAQVVTELRRRRIIVDTFSMGKEKFMGVAHCPNGQWFHFHIDIISVPEDEWGAALLWLTGSAQFDKKLRGKAKRMGLLLNHRGLFDENGDRIPVFTEKDIIEELNIPWIEPQYR